MQIIIFALSALCVIFVVVALAVPLAKAVKMPLPVVLATIGLTVALVSWLTGFGLAGTVLDTYDLWFIQSLALNSQSILLIFLPPLLFEMSLGVNVRRLIDDVWTVFVMAVLAVFLATVTVAIAVWSLSTFVSLVACLLLGAAISTTDPAAVVMTFREIGAPRRLMVILEGESLLNDAAAITLFTLLISIAKATSETNGFSIVGSFIYGFSIGAMAGVVLGWLASRLYSILGASATAEATLTLALAYGSFIIAEYHLGASGVVAVVFAGMTTRIVGVVKMGPSNWSTVMAVWTQIGFWANALILLLAATVAPKMLFALKWHELLLIGVVFVAAFLARAIILFGALPLMSRFGLTAPMTTAQKTLVCWGGVRGAVTLVLALSLAEIAALSGYERGLISALAAGFVFATLLVNASTLALVTRKLGLNLLSESDKALRDRIVAGTREEIRSYVRRLAADRDIAKDAFDELHAEYDEEIQTALAQSEKTGIEFGERLRLGLTILCNQELRLIQTAFENGLIGPRVTRLLRSHAERLSDAARINGRDGYETSNEEQLQAYSAFRAAIFLHRYFGIDRFLRDRLEFRLTLLLEMEANLKALATFQREVLPPMIGEDAAKNLGNLIDERLEMVRSGIKAIRLQYPIYTENMERILLLRAAARQERLKYESLHQDGIIGADLHKTLLEELDDRWNELERPPRLDLGLSSADLIEKVPLFSSLTAEQKRNIVARLSTRMAVPGETIVAAGERGNAMYFVASGVLYVFGLDEDVRLSTGDFFGELALLTPTRKRRTNIVAASFCRLLVLTRREYRRLIATDPGVERAIRQAAEIQLGAGFGAMLPEELDWSKHSLPEETAYIDERSIPARRAS
jgi:CPA1 family monovalent cation:H+ antiporter